MISTTTNGFFLALLLALLAIAPSVQPGAVVIPTSDSTPPAVVLTAQFAEPGKPSASVTAASSDATVKISGNDDYNARIQQLTKEVDDLQSAISARSAAFRAQVLPPVTPDDVRKALPPGSTLIEFASINLKMPARRRNRRRVIWLMCCRKKARCDGLN